MSPFIDFKALRQTLDARAIIAHYEIQIARENGDQFSVHCPWHGDKKPSMGINAQKRVFKCHSCGNGGNLLDLVSLLEGFDPKTSDGVRQGALAAKKLFDPSGTDTAQDIVTAHTTKRTPVGEEDGEQPESNPSLDRDTPNVPLNFELSLVASHKELRDRKFKRETYDKFGIGHCKRGMMKGRVCFPLKDPDGTLVGYAGRLVDGEPTGDSPRYLLPKNFNKSQILWNFERIRVWQPSHIVLVEGFWSVLRLEEANIPAVATLGHHLFQQQIDMLVADGVTQVTVIFDGDDPGRTGANEACAALAKRLFVRMFVLEDDQKPDTMPDTFLHDLPRFD